MIRSIEFPCDRNWIKNPNNNPLATMGARQGAAARTRLCIATIGLILGEHFTAPQPFHTAGDGHVRPNRWAVTLTRISMGTLDPITGGASMKVVQDAVATWCGVKNERDPVWAWSEPIRQEKRAKGFFGVRIEIEDLAPGEPRRVTLAQIDRFVWLAKQRLKEARSMTKKSRDAVPSWAREHVEAAAKRRAGEVVQTGRVLSYQPDAAARGASSAARGKAEAAFSKLTSRPARVSHTDCGAKYGGECRCGIGPDGRHDPHALDKPTALDLRDAAEGLGLGPGGKPGAAVPKPLQSKALPLEENRTCRDQPATRRVCTAGVNCWSLDADGKGPCDYHRRGDLKVNGHRDPGDEAPARDLADCSTCGAKVPSACKLDVGGRIVFGVHVARARAAGLHVPEDDRAHVRPAREPRPMAPETRCGRCGWSLREHVGGMRTCPGSGGLALRFFEPAASGETKARRLATVPGQARLVARRCYVALPWEQPRCEACEGRGASIGVDAGALATTCGTCEGRGYRVAKLTREQRLEGVDVDRPEARYKVPLAERARWGSWVTLHRTERTIAPHGVCWVYVVDATQANR